MTFTNEDLKRWRDHTKELADRNNTPIYPQGFLLWVFDRLEAAENLCRCCQSLDEKEFEDAWNSWRKAAGK